MSDPILRAATAADIPAITAIYRPAVMIGTASFEIEPPGETEMARRMGALRDAGYPYLVAELEGRVAGYAYTSAFRARPAYRFCIEDSIYVAPDAQGLGLGRRLLARLIDEATNQGFRQMIAVIGDSANAASIGVHRAAGFTPAGTLRSIGFKFDRWLDIVMMQRALADGDASLPSA